MYQRSKIYVNKDQKKHKNMKAQLQWLKMVTLYSGGGSQFWLGYIAANATGNNFQTNKRFNLDQWKQLSQTIQLILTLSQQAIIQKDNVYQIIVFSIQKQIDQSNSKIQKSINISRLRRGIQSLLNQIALDNNHLKNKFLNGSVSSIQKKQQSDKKQKIQTIKVKQQKQQQVIKIQNAELGIQCPICLCQVTLLDVCPVSCGHNLHKNCLIQHFKIKVESKKFPICCPQDGCNLEILIQDLQQYIPQQHLQKYYEFCLHQFVDKNKKNTNWCPTPGCSAVFSHDGELEQYRCLACKKKYCLRCKTQSHSDVTCEVNRARKDIPEEQKQFIKFAQGAKMKQCPSCLFWVEKNKGCDHMTCRCGYEFCFRCGAKYGQGACQCDQRDSFYGNDDEDESDGLDFADDIEYPQQEGGISFFIPDRAQQRLSRIQAQIIQRRHHPRQIRQLNFRYPPIQRLPRQQQKPPKQQSQSMQQQPSWFPKIPMLSNFLMGVSSTNQSQIPQQQRRRRIPFVRRRKSMQAEQEQDEDDEIEDRQWK